MNMSIVVHLHIKIPAASLSSEATRSPIACRTKCFKGRRAIINYHRLNCHYLYYHQLLFWTMIAYSIIIYYAISDLKTLFGGIDTGKTKRKKIPKYIYISDKIARKPAIWWCQIITLGCFRASSALLAQSHEEVPFPTLKTWRYLTKYYIIIYNNVKIWIF